VVGLHLLLLLALELRPDAGPDKVMLRLVHFYFPALHEVQGQIQKKQNVDMSLALSVS
jgi:hypothetical protein